MTSLNRVCRVLRRQRVVPFGDHGSGWRSEFALVAAFAAVGAIAYGVVLGETHNSTRTPLSPVAIAWTYGGLIDDRRFA